MSIDVKYSASTQTLALKKGNFWIGTGDVNKAPTSTTDYWNGITPPAGGYSIYLNKASNGPAIYTAASDSELITLTNKIAGTAYSTVNECFNYFNGQSDKMILDQDIEGVITNGLTLYYDAGFLPSYPRNGTTMNDLSGNGNNATLTNGPGYDTNNGGSLTFDYVDDYVISANAITASPSTTGFTMSSWIYPTYTQANFDASQIGAIVGGLFEPSSNALGICMTLGYGFGGLGANKGFVYVYDNFNSLIPVTASWTQNQWNYVACAQSGNNLKMWLNGSSIYSSTNFPRTYNITGYKFCISDNNSTVYGFKGRVAIASFYNRNLSDAEILTNYNAQRGRFGL
jgi:hypothetical protein